MISKLTGSIQFDNGDGLHAGLTKNDFFKLDIWKNQKKQERKPYWSNTTVLISLEGSRFILTAFFKSDSLFMIHLFDQNPESKEWSYEAEQVRKSNHDKFLNRNIGVERSFPWGKVASVYDDRSAMSLIIIQYTNAY